MLIFNEEKQILQEHYANMIKSYSASLENLVHDGNAEPLKARLDKIETCCNRIKWLEDEFSKDLDRCAMRDDK